MFRVSIMYPHQKGTRFDLNYYRTKHMELVKNLLTPFGLIKAEVDRGVSGGGEQQPPYICTGHLYFDAQDGYDKGVAAIGATLRGDIPNFTDVAPVRQISEIMG
jgi:uncharacterized protein (TIGR02118 family)